MHSRCAKNGSVTFIGRCTHAGSVVDAVGIEPGETPTYRASAIAYSKSVVAFVVVRIDDTSGWILAGLVAGLLGTLGGVLALVPVYSTSSHSLYKLTRIDEKTD